MAALVRPTAWTIDSYTATEKCGPRSANSRPTGSVYWSVSWADIIDGPSANNAAVHTMTSCSRTLRAALQLWNRIDRVSGFDIRSTPRSVINLLQLSDGSQ